MRAKTRELVGTTVSAFIFFLVCCAVIAFFGGVLGYILSEGATPELRSAASKQLRDSWGSAYPATIMLISALITSLAMIFRRLPYNRNTKAE